MVNLIISVVLYIGYRVAFNIQFFPKISFFCFNVNGKHNKKYAVFPSYYLEHSIFFLFFSLYTSLKSVHFFSHTSNKPFYTIMVQQILFEKEHFNSSRNAILSKI